MAKAQLVLALALAACTPIAAGQPTPTEDPRVAALSAQVADLTQRVQTLTAQRDVALATQLGAARDANTQVDVWYPMWNIPSTVHRGQHYVLGLPDTFTVRIKFTAPTPVRARVMSLQQLIRYVNTGTADIPASPVMSMDETFHDAEGCALYVLVLDADQETTVVPDVSITRKPGPPTGVCAN